MLRVRDVPGLENLELDEGVTLVDLLSPENQAEMAMTTRKIRPMAAMMMTTITTRKSMEMRMAIKRTSTTLVTAGTTIDSSL